MISEGRWECMRIVGGYLRGIGHRGCLRDV